MSLHAEALHVGGLSTPIQSDRALIKALTNDGEGVWKYGDFKATPNASSHAIDISPGYATVLGDNAADQGAYFCWSESSETIAWPAPSAQPRIDTLILRVADAQYGLVTGTNGARWDIIQGVPAASPVARSDSEINTTFAVPGGWLRIADIRVNTADTGVIPVGQFTDQRGAGLWLPDPQWTPYTPVFTATTNPTFTATGRYKVNPETKQVTAVARITVVTALGSGAYNMSYPVPAHSSYQSEDIMGTSKYRTNAGVYVNGVVSNTDGTKGSVLTIVPSAANANLNRWANNVPAGQVNGDLWFFSLQYEAA